MGETIPICKFMRYLTYSLIFLSWPTVAWGQVNSDYREIHKQNIHIIYEFYHSDTNAMYVYDSSGFMSELTTYTRVKYDQVPCIKKNETYHFPAIMRLGTPFWDKHTEYRHHGGESGLYYQNIIASVNYFNISEMGRNYYRVNYEEKKARYFAAYDKTMPGGLKYTRDDSIGEFVASDRILTVYNPLTPAILSYGSFNYERVLRPLDSLGIGDSVITLFNCAAKDENMLVWLEYTYIKKLNSGQFSSGAVRCRIMKPLHFNCCVFGEVHSFFMKEIAGNSDTSELSVLFDPPAMVKNDKSLWNPFITRLDKSWYYAYGTDPDQAYYKYTVRPRQDYSYQVIRY
jgi:hypothetical protein